MISLNDFQRQWEETGPDTLAATEAVGRSGWYILGNEVLEFERALSALCRTSCAVGVASGLDAIELSLRALGCQPGDKVLTTAVSAFATTLAILKLGAVPVFVDCDRFGLIDLELCREYLLRNRAVRFFVPVHLFGHSLNAGQLDRLRAEFDLVIVEDCAQAIGAAFRGTPVGTTGQMAATSFYPTKNLGALGDGGAVFTSNQKARDSVRRWRDYGQAAKYRHDELGYNSRLDELQAAILRRSHLPRLAKWTQRRRTIACTYLRGIHNPLIEVHGAPEGSDSCWHLFPVIVEPKAKGDFIAYLREKGIGSGEHYPTPIFDQRALVGITHEVVNDCPGARRFAASEVSLPIHPHLIDSEIQTVIEACNSWIM